MKKIEIDRLIKFPITNLLPVYDGFRGDDISSIDAYVRSRFLGSGIKTVIDLSEVEPNTRLKEYCKEWNVEYFHFPLDPNISKVITNRDLFTKLFGLFDSGYFYISCNNVFLIDIVLSCYWMFEVADKGYEPPRIIGFRDKENASQHLTVLISILDGLYQDFELVKEHTVPSETFQFRKYIIESQYNKTCSELDIYDKREVIDKTQNRINECIGRNFKINEAKKLIELNYPFQIWNVEGPVPLNFNISKLLQVRIVYEELYDLIETTDVKSEEERLFDYAVENYLSKCFPSKFIQQ